MVICLSYLTKITQLTIMKCKNTENKKCFLGLKLSPFIPMRSKFQNPSILKSMHQLTSTFRRERGRDFIHVTIIKKKEEERILTRHFRIHVKDLTNFLILVLILMLVGILFLLYMVLNMCVPWGTRYISMIHLKFRRSHYFLAAFCYMYAKINLVIIVVQACNYQHSNEIF